MSVEESTSYFEPVRKTVQLTKSPAEAFEIFTGGVSRWWPKEQYSVSGERTEKVVIEPVEGGAVYEVRDDGKRFAWGQVLIWENPHRLVLSWHPGYDASQSQEVEVRFEAAAGGTRVELEHRGWQRLGERARKARQGYDSGWAWVLGHCFVEECAA